MGTLQEGAAVFGIAPPTVGRAHRIQAGFPVSDHSVLALKELDAVLDKFSCDICATDNESDWGGGNFPFSLGFVMVKLCPAYCSVTGIRISEIRLFRFAAKRGLCFVYTVGQYLSNSLHG